MYCYGRELIGQFVSILLVHPECIRGIENILGKFTLSPEHRGDDNAIALPKTFFKISSELGLKQFDYDEVDFYGAFIRITMFELFETFWSVFIVALTYATPIFYPIEQLPPFMQRLEVLNPMYCYVSTFRASVLYGVAPSAMQIVQCIGFAVVALLLGVYVFRKGQDNFILYI